MPSWLTFQTKCSLQCSSTSMSSKLMTCLAAHRTQQAGTMSQVWATETRSPAHRTGSCHLPATKALALQSCGWAAAQWHQLRHPAEAVAQAQQHYPGSCTPSNWVDSGLRSQTSSMRAHLCTRPPRTALCERPCYGHRHSQTWHAQLSYLTPWLSHGMRAAGVVGQTVPAESPGAQ